MARRSGATRAAASLRAVPLVRRNPRNVSRTATDWQGFATPATWWALLIVARCLARVDTLTRSAWSARYAHTVSGWAGTDA